MAYKPVFGLHTAEFKHVISETEANSIKAYFNLNPDEELTGSTYFYQDGITRIWIEEVKGKKPRYYLHIIINFARAIRASNYKVMPYDKAGKVKKVFTAINKVLKALPLSDKNAVFQDWTPVRFDSAFDIYEEHTELLMMLLNRSVDLSYRKKRCKRIPIQGKTPQESECQSMRFGNNSFTYNIYRKLEEIQDKGKAITEEEKAEVQYLLRIERQNHHDAIKKLRPNMKASDLATPKVRDAILQTMIDEIGLFFGRGDFYSWKRITEVYYPHKEDIDTIRSAMVQITLNSLEAAQETYTADIRTIFDRLGLSPVGIRQDEAEQYNTEQIQGIYNRITAEFPRPPDKRQYNSFPTPFWTGDGRLKADITLYNAVSGRKKISVAGKTLEEYEHKVIKKLQKTYLGNFIHRKDDEANQDMILESADYILRFCRTAKTKEAKKIAEDFIRNFNLDNSMKSDMADNT